MLRNELGGSVRELNIYPIQDLAIFGIETLMELIRMHKENPKSDQTKSQPCFWMRPI